jgi:hypothetical protein
VKRRRLFAAGFLLCVLAVSLSLSGTGAAVAPSPLSLRDVILYGGSWEGIPRVFFGSELAAVRKELGEPDISSTYLGLVADTYGDLRVVYGSGKVALLCFATTSPAILSPTLSSEAPAWKQYPNTSTHKVLRGTAKNWRGGSASLLYWYADGMEIFGSRSVVESLDLLRK